MYLTTARVVDRRGQSTTPRPLLTKRSIALELSRRSACRRSMLPAGHAARAPFGLLVWMAGRFGAGQP
jgi:hypothetical protein